MISREETEALLNNEGDYLVRESKRKPGNYVLSARWEGIRHFIIQQDESVSEAPKLKLFQSYRRTCEKQRRIAFDKL